jgi:hypothetical protein
MKKVQSAIIILTILMISKTSSAQQINWRNLNDHKPHIVNVNLGLEYSTAIGIGYGQKLKTTMPLVLNIEYSSPFGNNIFDDFKTKFGGQAEVLHMDNFSVSVKVYGIFRRYENDLARLVDFGSEFSTNFGYYKTNWYVAGDVGFDKAIATHIKNSEEMKTIYPDVRDGWYVPTGGNFNFGIVSGYSFTSNDLYLKVGIYAAQDLKSTPAVPNYIQIGYNRRF